MLVVFSAFPNAFIVTLGPQNTYKIVGKTSVRKIISNWILTSRWESDEFYENNTGLTVKYEDDVLGLLCSTRHWVD